jgi:hypothetical protein
MRRKCEPISSLVELAQSGSPLPMEVGEGSAKIRGPGRAAAVAREPISPHLASLAGQVGAGPVLPRQHESQG